MIKNTTIDNKRQPKNQRCTCVIHLFKHKGCLELIERIGKDMCKCELRTKKQFDLDVQRTYSQIESRELT